MSGKDTITYRVGLDDTDSHDGGCTTHDLNSLITLLRSEISSFEENERRLVRLWPYAERRTRGNAALCLIATVSKRHSDDFLSILEEWVPEPGADDDRSSARPAIVVGSGVPPVNWYWDAVRSHVKLQSRIESVGETRFKIFTKSESPHGVIGASAAVAWPVLSHTWELVAWRNEQEIGSDRAVDPEIIGMLGERFPGTFANRDPTTGRCLVAPRTPCPVLYGIRGSNQTTLVDAHNWLQSFAEIEEAPASAVHRTNQCSDDHLTGTGRGTVTTTPVVGAGGHASLHVRGELGSDHLVAFKESGPVNDLLRELQVGDRIGWAGMQSPEGSIHLERMILKDPVPIIDGRPTCCGVAMKSTGRRSRLRCIRCGKLESRIWATKQERARGSWREPLPSNRRHLAKPLDHGPPFEPTT